MKRTFIFVLLLFMLIINSGIGCNKKAMNVNSISGANYIAPEISYTSNWKHFTVKHPVGFWQVIKKEQWTILYNNQDVPVQMIIDAHRNYFTKPDVDQQINKFVKSIKLKKSSKKVSEEKTTISGMEAKKLTFEGTILFDYWDNFRVKRRVTVISLTWQKYSYILAYISDIKNFTKYYSSFDNLCNSFRILEKEHK